MIWVVAVWNAILTGFTVHLMHKVAKLEIDQRTPRGEYDDYRD